MKELPKNPNTRQPYADVSLELDRYVGNVVEFLDTRNLSEADKSNLDVALKRLERAQLRARAVLDPTTLSDDDWKLAVISSDDASLGDSTAFMAGGKMLKGSVIVKNADKGMIAWLWRLFK